MDLDSSVLTIYGQHQKSTIGYNSRKRGQPSHVAVLCFEGHARECLEGALHPGTRHVLMVICPLIEQALGKPPKLQGLRVHADAAFSDGDFLQ